MLKCIYYSCILLATVLALSSCYIARAYRYRHFNLDDLDKLPAASLPAAPVPFRFTDAQPTGHNELGQYLDSQLAQTSTYAFLVIRNDTILYERYFNPVEPATPLPSFSVAKSFVATLVGIALDEGNIKSLSDPITQYLPELKLRNPRFELITIQHLLDMRSGIHSNEAYDNPFSDVLQLGFTKNIIPRTLRISIEKPPGTFSYKSVNTQLLGLIVERATRSKLQDYMKEKLWLPLGMEYQATWNTDSRRHNTVKAFCCINAAARDYAKFGRLYLHRGKWNGRQLIAEQWVHSSVSADSMQRWEGYHNQWWAGSATKVFGDSIQAQKFVQNTPAAGAIKAVYNRVGRRNFSVTYYTGSYHAAGILRQYIYVNPRNNTIIVRLGHNWQHPSLNSQSFIYQLGERL